MSWIVLVACLIAWLVGGAIVLMMLVEIAPSNRRLTRSVTVRYLMIAGSWLTGIVVVVGTLLRDSFALALEVVDDLRKEVSDSGVLRR